MYDIELLRKRVQEGITIKAIGKELGVSAQRIYQVMTKYGIETNCKKKKNFLVNKGPEFYWLNKMLCGKGVPKEDRLLILETMYIPRHCPALGMELNYNGTGEIGYSRGEDSPSIDRLDSSKGYTIDNIHIISWRANRIKNDSTPEELLKIYNYIKQLIK